MAKLHPKVAAGTTAGAASVLIVWLLTQLGIDMPSEVAAALATVLSAAGGYAKASS
jgi:hypothetical protein